MNKNIINESLKICIKCKNFLPNNKYTGTKSIEYGYCKIATFYNTCNNNNEYYYAKSNRVYESICGPFAKEFKEIEI